ncbi:hypothetical protein HY68_36260 [Streptomyces sp. AcH 505]|uniref:telomere-protecting terminal protein Tpg n=1 Tax=Streptomyces sp. AcH 505 TaxID=352211 RepID=UPI000591AE09|nr:hypothetical protein HY68_36260 [Streptomyces sp. AcH 505]
MLNDLHTNSIADAIDIADAHHWTRQPPRSDHARLRFLLRHHTNIHTLAAHLHTTPATVEEILARRETPKPGGLLHRAIVKDLIRLWQPRVRHRIHQQVLAGQHLGMMVHFRAWFGFTGSAGSSDEGRVRQLSHALYPPYPARLFDARYRNADEEELRDILGNAVGEAYFKVSPVGRLNQVRLTEIDFVEFAY